ncbi:MAG: UDP-N-acetylmuramate:L-alanyl-gamma-D-glutamyl-meso-diaminopimelate ligase [Gammaproteobacteria bacterium]|nr:UDP-N-acetylmuramate:L-alanyl-gamma-D-glutamyl-meso-diaminopimelate ligase [Gammaproteobacteria bacterium]
MHIHILGICGTFMGSLAIIAKQLGHTVSGSDMNVYPPMSTQLEMAGIELMSGYSVDHIFPLPDQIIVGNVMGRGNEVVEYLLNNHIPFTSGPAWLHDQVLKDRWVLAVAGTHGKTTTSSMLAWILESAGLKPGFLIGGVPENFDYSSRLGDSKYFVIEADEYDTAFFDKRSKFVHYCPHTLVLNNLEFDHADIFDDLDAIKRQFHHLIRILPSDGKLIINIDDQNIQDVIDMGCWTPTESFSTTNSAATWFAGDIDLQNSQFTLKQNNKPRGLGVLELFGRHNIANAIAAIAAAQHAGVYVEDALQALTTFAGVKRRLEHKGTFNNISVYDDFAHHPTEIAATISAFRDQRPDGRIITIFEPRSNSMRLGIHVEHLAKAFDDADKVFIFEPKDLQWPIQDVTNNIKPDAKTFSVVDDIILDLLNDVKPGDNVLILSNGSFDGLSEKLVLQLSSREANILH